VPAELVTGVDDVETDDTPNGGIAFDDLSLKEKEAALSQIPGFIPVFTAASAKTLHTFTVTADRVIVTRPNGSRRLTRPGGTRRVARRSSRRGGSRASPDDPEPEPDRVARPQLPGELRGRLKVEVDRRRREQVADQREADRLFVDEVAA
jgi:hypothetical protein